MVAYTRSYTYLGVTFIGPLFALQEAAYARHSHGYEAPISLKDNLLMSKSMNHTLNHGCLIYM